MVEMHSTCTPTYWFLFIGCTLLLAGCPREDEPAGSDGGAGSTCTTASQCASNLVCVAGTCQFAGTVTAGGACWAHRDCASGLYCAISGMCESAGTGQEGALCATGADCDKSLVCDRSGVAGVCAAPGDAELGQTCAATLDCMAGLACDPSGFCRPAADVYPGFDGVSCAPDGDIFGVLFEVPRPGAPAAEFYRLPFPNDIRVRDDGTLALDDFPRPGATPVGRPGVDVVDLLADALSQDFVGFASQVSVRLRFSRAFNGDFGPSAAYFRFVDITAGAPEFGNDVARSLGYGTAPGKYVCQHSVVVRNNPDTPLLPGHTYAVYVTTDVRSADGAPPQVSPDFAAVMAAERPAGDDALARAWDVYAPLRAYLADQGIDPGTLAGAAVFTVGDPVARARTLLDHVQTTPGPIVSDLTLCGQGVPSPCGQAERGCGPVDSAFHEIHGRYRVPVFQQGTTPYERDGGDIAVQNGVFQQNGNIEVCFALTVPKVPAGQEPAAWPLVVYGHGTGGAFNDIVRSGVARNLATAPVPAAVLSFDAVVHGERRGDSQRPAWTLMLNVENPRATRDLRLQAAVDAVQALRIPQAGALEVPGLAPVVLDSARTLYMGHSQGADAGLMIAALGNPTPALVVSAAGGYMSDRMVGQIHPFAVADGISLLLDDSVDLSHPYMTLWQTYLDGVDPINHAPRMFARPLAGVMAKHVLAIWGEADAVTPSRAGSVLIQAMRLPVAQPVLEDVGTGALLRPVTGNKATADGARTAVAIQVRPQGSDGSEVALVHPAAISDWVAFVSSYFESGAPTLP